NRPHRAPCRCYGQNLDEMEMPPIRRSAREPNACLSHSLHNARMGAEMDELLEEFLAETREMLEALGGELVSWEDDPSDRARLDTIFRFFHTVKGNCGFFDFPRLQALSHAAEDALADVRADRRQANSALVSAVLAIVDR